MTPSACSGRELRLYMHVSTELFTHMGQDVQLLAAMSNIVPDEGPVKVHIGPVQPGVVIWKARP
jgi:hypothetical protein